MKISIITINYNNREGLKRTVNSVVAQTCKDFEWIIVDGGSTDGSKELIEQYSAYITSWVSEPDQGIYNAMNKGIERANGDYLLFLNSGDWFVSDDIMYRVYATDIYADFVYGLQIIKNPNGLDEIWDIPLESITGLYFLKSSLPHQATFIHRKIFENFGCYDESYYIVSDWKLFMEAVVFGGASIQKLHFAISVFNRDGLSANNIDLLRKEKTELIDKIWPAPILADYDNYKALIKESQNELVVLALKVFHTNRLLRVLLRGIMNLFINIDGIFKRSLITKK